MNMKPIAYVKLYHALCQMFGCHMFMCIYTVYIRLAGRRGYWVRADRGNLCTDSLAVIKSIQSITSVREDLLIELLKTQFVKNS